MLTQMSLKNFLLAFFTPFIVSAIDFRYGFVFAACNLLGAVVVWFFLYESAGLSLENVDIVSLILTDSTLSTLGEFCSN